MVVIFALPEASNCMVISCVLAIGGTASTPQDKIIRPPAPFPPVLEVVPKKLVPKVLEPLPPPPGFEPEFPSFVEGTLVPPEPPPFAPAAPAPDGLEFKALTCPPAPPLADINI